MGQAKLKGSFEERRAKAEEALALKIQKKKEEEAAYWNSLSEEEKDKIKKRRVRTQQLMTFALGLSHSANIINLRSRR